MENIGVFDTKRVNADGPVCLGGRHIKPLGSSTDPRTTIGAIAPCETQVSPEYLFYDLTAQFVCR
jgi:hypothetical protein